MGYLPEKSKILGNLFFHRNQRKIVNQGSPPKKVFDPWIKSYEAYSIFRTSVILEYVILKFVTYVHISNWNFMTNSVQSKTVQFHLFRSSSSNPWDRQVFAAETLPFGPSTFADRPLWFFWAVQFDTWPSGFTLMTPQWGPHTHLDPKPYT